MGVFDVRPSPEYAAGHIRGFQSVPIRELRKHVRFLPADTSVVARCRACCAYADDAVRELAAKGFHASRLEDRYPEWRPAGRPTAVGS